MCLFYPVGLEHPTEYLNGMSSKEGKRIERGFRAGTDDIGATFVTNFSGHKLYTEVERSCIKYFMMYKEKVRSKTAPKDLQDRELLVQRNSCVGKYPINI